MREKSFHISETLILKNKYNTVGIDAQEKQNMKEKHRV